MEEVLLGRDAILDADDLEFATVYVDQKGWKGNVRVRGLTAEENDDFERSIMRMKVGKDPELTMANFRAKLCVLAIVDEDGNRLFSEIDTARLGEKSAKALKVIFDKVRELSGMTDEDVEEMASDFVEAPEPDSNSESPDISVVPDPS